MFGFVVLAAAAVFREAPSAGICLNAIISCLMGIAGYVSAPGLKKGVAYKYCVAAYKIKNGKKQIVKKSVSVHSVAGNLMKKKAGKFTNVKSVSVKKNAVTLKVGMTYRIQPSVKGVYSGCAILQKDHAAMFRYLYIKTGKNISVSSSGTVKALKAGKCNVYVLGTNGVRTKVAVTVVK
ncbi:MAG: hypothetical protein LKG42_00040 [Eubacterium sp.]|nr:hypothetical protein [Eubacterium sp.]MCI1428027.1 hypothetical protein [Eubacterium sp.]MCI1456304.1 hypothetical protein [Eubacterium sp.]MCI1512103.1 hypothetical protein [Eubacterium sp.]MCI1520744.1 hypothetical protein [Eubacterium sp.]